MDIIPEYQPVLDSLNPKSEATVTQKSLGSVFKRVSIFTSKSNNSVTFDFGESGLILSTSNPDFGDFKEEIDADYVGDPIRIAFNIRYFQDILSAVDGDHLRLEFGSDLDPCVVKILVETIVSSSLCRCDSIDEIAVAHR